MQVPERLALMGGGILLSSTLIFTLKSQASSIIPNMGHSISNVYDHVDDTQKDVDFIDNLKNSQRQGKITGHWGTASFYVDEQNVMHVGKGQLNGSYHTVVDTNQINGIEFDQPGTKAPADSTRLLASNEINYHLQSINGLDNLDTSGVQNMTGMFQNDRSVTHLDVSSFDTSRVTDMPAMFMDTYSLKALNLGDWNTSQVNTASEMLADDTVPKLILGSHAKIPNDWGWGGTYRNGDQVISTDQMSIDSNHPGTWTRQ